MLYKMSINLQRLMFDAQAAMQAGDKRGRQQPHGTRQARGRAAAVNAAAAASSDEGEEEPPKKKIPRSSIYRGVTKHRRSGRSCLILTACCKQSSAPAIALFWHGEVVAGHVASAATSNQADSVFGQCVS